MMIIIVLSHNGMMIFPVQTDRIIAYNIQWIFNGMITAWSMNIIALSQNETMMSINNLC